MIACYVSFGSHFMYYLQSAFSILTFLSEPLVKKISVVTERPELYAFLEGRVEILAATKQELAEWAGPEKYTFRIKTLGFDRAIKHNPGRDILCVDGDTFRADPITAAGESLARGRFGLHEQFGRMIKAADGGNKRMFQILRGKTIAGYTVTDKTHHLNSGVTAIPGKFAEEVIKRILRATDEIYSLSGGFWATEEFACNFACASLGPVDDVSEGIGHYFQNKAQWNSLIERFFTEHRMKNSSLDDMIAAAAAFDFTQIPVYLHQPKRRRLLLNLADKYFPMRNARYYPNKTKEWK